MELAEQSQRRRFRRVGSKAGTTPLATATYSLLADARSREHEVPVLDLSEGGLCLLASEELDPGLTMRIVLHPLEGEGAGYRLLAEIRWGAERDDGVGYIYGLEFLPISIAETRNLRGIHGFMESWEERFGSA